MATTPSAPSALARAAAEAAPPPSHKERGERVRRLRWMAGEVARIQEEQRAVRAALDDLLVAGRRGPLPQEERTRRRDLGLRMQALRYRLQELRDEFSALTASGAD